MKKLKALFIFILIISLKGCALNDPQYINLKEKPKSSYYTQEIKSKILNGTDYTLKIFNTDLYKTFDVPTDEKTVLENFINYIPTESYKDNIELEDTEPYHIKIIFSDDTKYLIKVYDNTTVSVLPWDGVFKEDIITMDQIPEHYNLYDFCTHIDTTDLK